MLKLIVLTLITNRVLAGATAREGEFFVFCLSFFYLFSKLPYPPPAWFSVITKSGTKVYAYDG